MKRKRIFLWLLLVVLLAGAVLVLWRPAGSADTPSLFSDLPASDAPSGFSEQSIAKRHRWVQLDQLGVSQLSLKPGEEKRVVLNLFPDLEVEATIKANKTHWNKDQSAMGLIDDNPDTLLVMSFHQDVMMGLAVLDDGRQVLISHVVDGKYVIAEVDPSKLGGCGTCVEMPGENSGGPKQQRKAAAPERKKTGEVKTSAASQSTWSRRLAMADPEIMEETSKECAGCSLDVPDNDKVRMRPMLAALGVPPTLLAGANTGKYGLHGAGGNVRQSMGPTSAHSIHFQRSGFVEYLDVLFIYDNDLVAQEGDVAGSPVNIQAKVTRMIDATNHIFLMCGIPLEVRQADLLLGRFRAMGGNDPDLTASGYSATGPAWKQVQAPVQPDHTTGDAKTFTVWSPTGTQKQAKVGIYEPLYVDLDQIATSGLKDENNKALAKDISGYLAWVGHRHNSLLYGDQYWGGGNFDVGGSQEPYINLPEGTIWRLEPQGKPNPIKFSSNDNPGLRTGPVDHPSSPAKINAEPGMTDISHDAPVFRYDQGGVADTYGAEYNGTYSGVLGHRMDLNNIDYAGNSEVGAGNPRFTPRYPILHGETGDFNATFNINSFDPTKRDSRPDFVCVLAADTLPGGAAGLAWMYQNSLAATTGGRGPSPAANDIHQTSFSTHQGNLITGASAPYVGTFTPANLVPVGVVNNTVGSGLAAYYAFTGNTNDDSPNGNAGTMVADATYGADVNGTAAQALALDGAGDYMSVADNAAISGLSKISMGGWVKLAGTAGQRVILSKWPGGGAGEFQLAVVNGSTLRVRFADGTNNVRVDAAYTFTAGIWYHVYATYNGQNQSGVKLYVNGFRVASSTTGSVTGALANTADVLTIGARSDGTQAINGSVDQVRIYGVELTAGQIQDMYVVERAPSSFDPTLNLVAHYPFEDTSLFDSSAQANHAALTGAPAPVVDRYNAPGNNDAYLLSAGNTINTQTSKGFPIATGDFTLSLWLNNATAGGFGGNNQTIVANQAQNQFELRVRGGNGRLGFYTGFGTTPDHETTTDLNWVQSNWYQVVVTRVGNTITFYRDGLKIGNSGTTTHANGALPVEQFLTFGDSPGAALVGDEINAHIDDVRLYDRGLAGSDVGELYLLERASQGPVFDQTTGLQRHYPISKALYGDSLGLVNDIVPPGSVATANLVAWGDGRSGAADIEGAYDFASPAAYLNLGKTLPAIGNGSFTISFWANATAFPGGTNTADIIGNRETSNTNSWWVDVNSTGHLSFNANNGTAFKDANSTLALQLGAWQQVVITRSATGGAVKMYIDGVPAGSGTVDLDTSGISEELWIGKGGAPGAGAYSGKLDEIRIYLGRELGDGEVSALYSTENVTVGGSASIKVNFSSTDDSGAGDSVQMELFNNYTTDPPFYTMDYNSSGSSYSYSFNASSNGNAWQDKQGTWRITPLTGSVLISSVEITINGLTFIHKGAIAPTFTVSPSLFDQNLHMNRDRFFGSVVMLNAGVAGYTFPHELGHNLGLSHGLGDQEPGRGPLRDDSQAIVFNPYGSLYPFVNDEFLAMGNHFMAFGTSTGGGTFGNYATIMAYTTIPNPNAGGTVTHYTRIPRYSSPNVIWKSKPTGDNHGRMLPPPQGHYNRPMYTDQVRVIRITGEVASYYRDDNGSGRLAASAAVPVIPPKGIPDAGGMTRRSDPNRSMAKGGGSGGGGSADGSSRGGIGGSSRPPSPGVPPSNPGSGRANPVTGGGVIVLNPGSNPGRSTGSGGGIGGSVGTGTKPSGTKPSGTKPGIPVGSRPGQGKPAGSVPNDSPKRSQSMPLKAMADMSYGSTINGHNRGAGVGGDAAAKTDDGQKAFHGRSVWWHVAAPANGVYDLEADTHGSGIDTTLGVWLEDDGKMSSLGVNDNDPRRPGPSSAVRIRRITLRKGQRILLALAGVNGAQGQVRLNIRLNPVR